MNKKGFTMVEIIVSVGLISLVMLLLFQLLTDMEYENKHSSFSKENQINRATVMKTVQQDLMNNNLSNVTIITQSDRKEIDFQFETFTRTLTVYKDRISYNNEVWMLESSYDEVYFDLNRVLLETSVNSCTYVFNVDVNGDGICDYNCDENNNGFLDEAEDSSKNDSYRICPAYKSYRVVIPVVNNEEKENNIDDLEFFYIGK